MLPQRYRPAERIPIVFAGRVTEVEVYALDRESAAR
jgi:hypothetical protein